MDKVEIFEELLKLEVKKMPKRKIGLAFSGGIDSAVIGKLMKNIGIDFIGYVVSIEKSKDLESARKVSKEIGFPLREIIVSEKDVEEAQNFQEKILKDLGGDVVSVAFNIPIYFVCKNAEEKSIVICQGPDPMLGGYRRYGKMSKEKAMEEMRKETKEFFGKDFKQNWENAKYFGKNLIMPYIGKEIIKFCEELDFEDRINEKENKHILRELGRKLGLREETCSREKQACQYGSGIIKMLMKITKRKKKIKLI